MSEDPELTRDTLAPLAERLGLAPDALTEVVDSAVAIIDSTGPANNPVERDEAPFDLETDVDRADPHNAFVTSLTAARPDAEGPLDDVRVAVKDNIAMRDVGLTAGSSLLADAIATRSARVVHRLLDAGATIIGKTNMDEFAFGPTGETSHFGPTENPAASGHTPGGSSSGSGAAVAADMADIALGTDTGGSVRIPASYCGVVGLKPTLGRVPLDGVIELAGSLDTVGVLAQTVDDVATAFAVIVNDRRVAAPFEPADPESVTIGLPQAMYDDPVAPAIAERVRALAGALEDHGADLVDVALPWSEHSSALWRVISMSELYAYFHSDALPYRLADADAPAIAEAFAEARRGGLSTLSPPLKTYLLVGAYLVHEDRGRRYARAIAHRQRIARSINETLEGVDVLLTPTTPTTAYAFGEFSRETSPPINANTHPFNLSGHPAVSVPGGAIDGLPFGVQAVGQRGDDGALLGFAATLEGLVGS